MIPGVTTKLTESTMASADSISVKTDIVNLTGTTTINTILPNFGGGIASGFVILIPLNGGITIGTAGNILVGLAAAQNRALMLIYVRSLNKWIIENGV